MEEQQLLSYKNRGASYQSILSLGTTGQIQEEDITAGWRRRRHRVRVATLLATTVLAVVILTIVVWNTTTTTAADSHPAEQYAILGHSHSKDDDDDVKHDKHHHYEYYYHDSGNYQDHPYYYHDHSNSKDNHPPPASIESKHSYYYHHSQDYARNYWANKNEDDDNAVHDDQNVKENYPYHFRYYHDHNETKKKEKKEAKKKKKEEKKNNKNNRKIQRILHKLDKKMQGSVLFASNTNYTNNDQCVSSGFCPWNPIVGQASYVIQVANEADVALAVPVLANIEREYNVSFRIRSGGHSYAGYSGIERGIVLSLQRLDAVLGWNIQTLVATLGPAVNAERILDTFLLPYHLYTPTGWCPYVAEGGYVGGGGIGPAMRQFGLGLDNVVQLRAALANGTVVVASADHNPDLFWALRGAGHNSLAIVTQIKVQLHPMLDSTPMIISQPLSWELLASVCQQVGQMALTQGLDRRIFFRYEEGVYLGHLGIDEASVQFGEGYLPQLWQQIIPSQALDSTNMELSTKSLTSLIKSEVRKDMYLQAFFGFLPPEHNTAQAWTDITKALANITESCAPYASVEIQLLQGAVADVAPTDTAFAHRNALYIIGIQLLVPKDTNDSLNVFQTHVATAASLWSKLWSLQLLEGAYPNYAMPSLSSDEYPSLYWGDNLERLVHLKEQYDSENVFHMPQSVPLHMGPPESS